MRKLILFVLPLVLAACTKEVAPPPLPRPVEPSGTTTVPAANPTTTVTATPGQLVVGTCVIGPETSCTDAYMARANLAGADLHGADLTGANLVAADLRRVNLQDATLKDANLKNTDLSSADLSGADMTGAILRYANVAGANMEGAALSPSQLSSLQMCKTIRPDGRRDDSGCAASGGDTTAGPLIVEFSMSESVACSGTLTTVQVPVTWQTKKTKSVTFEIDGKALPADQVFSRSGEDKLDFACKKQKHVYTLVAASKSGAETQKNITVKRAA